MDEETGKKMGEQRNVRFDLLMNAGNEFLVVLDADSQKVSKPRFVYSGKEKAVLFKNEDADGLVFSPIPKEAWKDLVGVKKILCVEIKGGHIINEYMARVEQ